MWARNLLFIGSCIFGLAGLAHYLSPGDGIGDPRSYDRSEYEGDDFRFVIDQINHEFRHHWQSHQVAAAPRVDPLTVTRRLSLGLTGTIPSLEEIRRLGEQPESEQIAWWIARLLDDRRSADYLAERLARVYVGTENGPFLIYRRRRFVTWLSDRLHENMPYDQLVRTLISDTGLWTDSPAVNFLTVTVDQNEEDEQPDEVRLAGRTARAFLGVRLDCMQCHDDNMEGQWGQKDFHQLAAFFSEARQSFTGIQDKKNEYEYTYLGEEASVRVPAEVPFFAELLTRGGTRREQLANWVTHQHNAAFARTMVNRIWAVMFGRPLVKPIDNIPLEGPYPPGMDTLAQDFVQSGYDLERLVKLIAATEVYQLDSRAEHEINEADERHWAVFPLTRLRAEQAAGALVQSARLTTIDANSHILVRLARQQQVNDFIDRYGDTGEDEFTAHGGTIPQRLLMMNGNLVKQRTKEDLLTNAATRIALLAPNDKNAVESAYLAVLTRKPSREEASYFEDRLQGSRGPARTRRLEDLYWVLLNSTEFSWNH